MKKTHTILVFAQNKRGVLEKITMLIRKKMYNLEQITASDTQVDKLKRITITFTSQESAKISQIISQIQKIVEVVEVEDTKDFKIVQSECLLIKVRKPENLSDLLKVVNAINLQVVDASKQSIILQAVGDIHHIDSAITILKDFEILEMGRSGSVAMKR